MSYFIVTDSASDMSEEHLEQLNVGRYPLTVHFQNGTVLEDSFSQMSSKEFYDGMRKGMVSTTSQVNVSSFLEMFRQALKEYDNVLYMGLSSALSGTYQSALLAKTTLEDEDPAAVGRITLVDTKGASLGIGLLVLAACRMRDEGASLEETAAQIETLTSHINHWFTVDDLVYLKRGGRISGIKAAVGQLLNIKPILSVNQEGKLVPTGKAKGRKKSIHALMDRFREMYDPSLGKDFAISHADCLDDANMLAQLIQSEFDMNEPVIENVGMVIGSHAGPGTVALFFPGRPREDFNPDL